MGDMPLICHSALAIPAALEFIKVAGLVPPTHLLTYNTPEEAAALSRKRINLGEKLAYVYPPLNENEFQNNLLVSSSLYGYLNDKAHIPELVESKYIPKRNFLSADKLIQAKDYLPDVPVYIKASVEAASGAGYDVRFCSDKKSRELATSWFSKKSSDLKGIVIEEAIDVKTCWCMGVAIKDEGCDYLGASIQIFDEPAKQSGNRVDNDNMPPIDAVNLTKGIAERAHAVGYRGVAGFDIGIDDNGGLFVFDLNFRLNACTSQLLIHGSASKRIGASISQTWAAQSDRNLQDSLECLLPYVEKGLFVPTRLFDRDTYLETMPGTKAVSLLNGLIFADTIEEVDKLANTLQVSIGQLNH
jgi:hypothetical protein